MLGQFGATNGVSGYVLKGQRFDRYTAEAGMQRPSVGRRASARRGGSGTHCPDFTAGGLNSALGPNATRSVPLQGQSAGFDDNGLPAPAHDAQAYTLIGRRI